MTPSNPDALADALNCITPEMLAAAWGAWHFRHGGKLGPGPAFAEAIAAAMAVATILADLQRVTAERDVLRQVAVSAIGEGLTAAVIKEVNKKDD